MASTRFFQIILIIACSGIPLCTYSQEPFTSGWYAGAGISVNDVYSYDDQCWGCYGSAEYGDNDTSFTLSAGFRVSEYLAIEASYLGKSTMHWDHSFVFFDAPFDVYVVDADVELSSYQINVFGILAGQLWEGYLRGGLALWDAQSSQAVINLATGGTQSLVVDERGTDFSLGIGVGRRIGDDWQVRLDYAYFRIDDDLLALGGDEKAYSDFMTLQIVRRFGRNR